VPNPFGSSGLRYWTLNFLIGYVVLSGFIIFKRGPGGFTLMMALGIAICSAFMATMLYFLYGRKRTGKPY